MVKKASEENTTLYYHGNVILGLENGGHKYFVKDGKRMSYGMYQEDRDVVRLVHFEAKVKIEFRKREDTLVTESGEILQKMTSEEARSLFNKHAYAEAVKVHKEGHDELLKCHAMFCRQIKAWNERDKGNNQHGTNSKS